MTDKDNKQNNNKTVWWQPAVFMFLRLSVWIAAPVLLAVFFGKWLDKKFGTEPWLFLVLVGMAFLISMFVLAREVTKEYNKIEKKNNNNNKN